MNKRECPHFVARDLQLFDPTMSLRGPCRYHLGGKACSRRDVFLCDTEGHKQQPQNARGARNHA